jgi:Nitrile hydratase, alpha chain
MTREEQERKFEKVIATALVDKAFKQKLMVDPVSVLRAEGVEIRPGVEIRVVEDTENVHHLLLPVKPSGKELTDDQLKQIAGGVGSTSTVRQLVTAHANL